MNSIFIFHLKLFHKSKSQYFPYMKSQKKAYVLLIVLLSAVLFIFRDIDNTPLQMRLLSTLDASLVTTTHTRTSSVQEFCTSSKTDLVSDADKTTNTQYFSIMNTYFKTDITSVLKDLVGGDTSGAISSLKDQGTTLGIYVAPFLIGFILSIFLWAFLCCCCTCTSCCPSKCCQHDPNVLYTKCELLWPAIFLLVCLALAVATSIPGITQASKLTDSVKTMECGVSLVMDDLLNGNMTLDSTSFFSGTNTLVGLFTQLKVDLNDISTNISNVKTSVDNVKSESNTIMTNIQGLGLSGSNNSFSLTYTDPTPSGGSYSANSIFGSILGNPTISNTLSYISYLSMQTIYNSTDALSTIISDFNNSAGSGTLTNAIDEGINQFTPINTQINSIDTTLYDMFSVVGPILNYIKLAVLIFFAVSMGLAALVIIGVIFTAFCDMPKCRHLMYISCVIIVVILVLGFLITTIMSLLAPVLYMGCTVLNSGLNTQAGFINLTANLGLGTNNVASLVSVCLPGGDGKILQALGVPALDSLSENLQNMTTIINDFKTQMNYDPTPLSTAAADMSTVIGNYQAATMNDIFDNNDALTYFKSLANQSRFSSCSDSNYLADSLVPSTNSNSTSYVGCSKATIRTCTSSSDNFQNIGAGCIDMASCFQYYTVAANIQTHIDARYSGIGGCAGIGSEVEQLYTNWDKKRRDTSTGISAVKSKYDTDVKGRIDNQLTNDFTDLKGNCTQTITTLESISDSLTNPTYGMLAGLNCRVLGEDIIIAKDTVCVSLFNSIFFLLVTVGATSFAFLFAICCITCTGVRHYKQDQTKQKIGNGGNGPDFYEQTQVKLQNNHYS